MQDPKQNLVIDDLDLGQICTVAIDPLGDYILVGGAKGIRLLRYPQLGVRYAPQPFQNDQPDGEDRLAVAKELYALADVLMMRSLEPPIAVAILGGWGSGKSFGMHLLQQRITDIRCQKLEKKQTWGTGNEADEAVLSPYVGHIYQINFDAWTYAKSDLWASLMQTIFFELNRQLNLEKQLAKIGAADARAALKAKLQSLPVPEQATPLTEPQPKTGFEDRYNALAKEPEKLEPSLKAEATYFRTRLEQVQRLKQAEAISLDQPWKWVEYIRNLFELIHKSWVKLKFRSFLLSLTLQTFVIHWKLWLNRIWANIQFNLVGTKPPQAESHALQLLEQLEINLEVLKGHFREQLNQPSADDVKPSDGQAEANPEPDEVANAAAPERVISEEEAKQFEAILLEAAQLQDKTTISPEKLNHPETGQYWQVLNQIDQDKEDRWQDLIFLAKNIQADEADFLCQGGNVWAALNTLSETDRTFILQHELNSQFFQAWQEGTTKGDFLWDMLSELRKEEQKKLNQTHVRLEDLQQQKARLEKVLQFKRDQAERKVKQAAENAALAKVFFSRLQHSFNNGTENFLATKLLKASEINVPQLKATLENPEVKQWLADTTELTEANRKQIEPLLQDADKIKSFLQDKPQNKLTGLIDVLKHHWVKLVLFIFLISVPILVYRFLPNVISLLPQSLLQQIPQQITQLISSGQAAIQFILATAFGIPSIRQAIEMAKKILQLQSQANREFQAFQAEIDQEQQQLAINQSEQIQQAIETSQNQQDYQKIEEQLAITKREIAKLEIQAEEQRQQAGLTVQFSSLLEFVSDRLEENSYRQRLGLMHQIKNDLEDLSDRLTCELNNQNPDRLNTLKQYFPRGSARVVLYIDDLDRCPPQRVVEVLEAVQLLLKTQLFVVILAIDDRYIVRALESAYPGVLKRRGTPSGFDYLEKIIQIPYRMRTVSGKDQMVSYLKSQIGVLEEEFEAEQQAKYEAAAKTQRSSPRDLLLPDADINAEAEAENTPEPPIAPSSTADPVANPAPETPPKPAQPTSPKPSSQAIDPDIWLTTIVRFTQAEFDLIQDCIKHVDLSPRTVKRIGNICKILKLIWTPTHETEESVWNTEPSPAVKQTTIAFLVLSARYPHFMRSVIDLLYTYFENPTLLTSDSAITTDEAGAYQVHKPPFLKELKAQEHCRDSHTQREFDRFEQDFLNMPPQPFLFERRTFNLILSFCFVGDLGYDPDDHAATPMGRSNESTNGKTD